MAKETKQTTPLISACEEYVVEELKKAQKTIAELSLKLSQKDFDFEHLQTKHLTMFAYLLLAFSKASGSYVEINDYLVSVYVLGHYIGLFNKDKLEDDKDRRLYANWQIIEKVQEKPTEEKEGE